MSNDLIFYQRLADLLTQEAVAIATVIQTQGSVPREVGAKLMFWGDRHTFGTIGGGVGEAKVLRQAEQVLATGHKQQVTIDLSGAPNRDIQGVCGGQMQVWVERWQGEGAIALAHQILSALNNSQSITLMIPLSQEYFPYVALSPRVTSPFSDVMESVSGLPRTQTIQLTLQPLPTLLIVGGGHCGIELAKAADFSGFQVMVQDERSEWANRANFPQASCLFNQPIVEIADELVRYEQLYVALVTRGLDYDLPVLRLLFQSSISCRYIGMMGSQKRIQIALKAMEPYNIDPEKLNMLYAPIGLDIGALTPEEIAISICAELIRVRRSTKG